MSQAADAYNGARRARVSPETTAAVDTLPFKAGGAPIRDRLLTTLFLFSLLHGIVIMGVSFTSGALTDDHAVPTLEVLLVSDDLPESRPNDKADYLAQRNQQGSGNLRERERPTSPRSSPLPLNNPGVADGNGLQMHRAGHDTGNEDLVAGTARAPAVRYFASPSVDPAAKSEQPLLMTAERQSALPAANEADRLALHGRNERELGVTPNTLQSNVAVYLDSWRRKVERVGTLNFPVEARNRATSENPVLEVAIRSDGTLDEVVVRRSSGSHEVDQAAVAILKLASPFDPFPRELTVSHDSLRFAKEFQFLGGRLVSTPVEVPAE
jgi:periplasmic protein TonB